MQDIALVERKMDEIPSRSELQQYQSQFIELYEQVAVKLKETRKYYQMYNSTCLCVVVLLLISYYVVLCRRVLSHFDQLGLTLLPSP